jgi:hypothetical protein
MVLCLRCMVRYHSVCTSKAVIPVTHDTACTHIGRSSCTGVWLGLVLSGHATRCPIGSAQPASCMAARAEALARMPWPGGFESTC